ncbi:39S ribosomal protein L42, mitochondrial [Bombina bombina]|uniref:39S ribosomal protein L42, mitochondrial n=1 Tax=Bombina bombina TaxID=8345 RepID=UPI00235B01CF|nr:39S ribosomal protein L42, mitochondrial [Bombina bombina]
MATVVLATWSRTGIWCWRGLRSTLPSLLNVSKETATGGGVKHSFRQQSSYSALPEDYNCKVELAMTSDGKTIVCYHPSVDIPYEHTKPMPRQDPVHNQEETQDHMLKARLSDTENKPGPTMEELSKMFYTTKHRWYPIGQYHRRRINKNPPKDR